MGGRLLALGGFPIHIPTSRGAVRARIVRIGPSETVALSRHAAGHRVPPHRVPYLAIAEALRRIGVERCLATAAVGSLRPDWPSGTLAVCRDCVDLSARNLTHFDRSVAHTDCSEPFSPVLRRALASAARTVGLEALPEAVYVQLNGPRYETPQEVRLLQSVGDVVGMTAASEALAMRESGIQYGCLAIVTNLAAGLSGSALSHTEVEDQMRASGEAAFELLSRAISELE